jgi:hypothetical protein
LTKTLDKLTELIYNLGTFKQEEIRRIMDKNTRQVHGVVVPRLITRGFSFTADELDTIHQKAVAQGDNNDSAALRVILREWAALKAMLTSVPAKSPIKVTPETVASMGIVDGPINSTSVIHYTINPEDSNG